MFELLYTLGINLYVLGIRITSLWNDKAKLWIEGRQHWAKKLRKQIQVTPTPLVWFHCASLGEFEQARPLIELHKKTYPKQSILLSFFSPSGYENRKNYELADIITYLPIDSQRNAKKFLDITAISKAYFTKYEIWPNYLKELNKRAIPTILFSSVFREKQIYFRSYGAWFKKALHHFKAIHVQNHESLKLLQSIGISATVTGDTRFDRVWEIAKNTDAVAYIADFKGKQQLIVAGSTWPMDEEHLLTVLKIQNCKLIIAPHEIDEKHLSSIERLFPNAVRYSMISEESFEDSNVLIIDQIGLLSKIYQYADIAYIGGGFGVGIHNTLEAAAYGCPIIFGPNYQKFEEAKALINLGAAYSYSNSEQLQQQLLKWLVNAQGEKKAARDYVENNLGAAQKILSYQ